MTADVHPGGLFDARGHPVGDTPPYWGPSLLGPTGPRQDCVMLEPLGRERDYAPVRLWLAPMGPFEFVPELVVAELVSALDAGGSVLLCGSAPDCLVEAGRIVASLAGGGHA